MTTATTFGRPTLTGNVVFIGDSQFTKGLGGPLETDLDIPTVVGKILNAPGITIHNKAVGGATSVGTVQNLEGSGTLDSFDATQPVSAAVIMIGGNDIHYHVIGHGGIYQNWREIAHQCRVHGAKQVIGCTTTPRHAPPDGVDFEADRVVLNAMVAEMDFLDAFVDLRHDPLMGAPDTCDNPLYFWQEVPGSTPPVYDRVHYTHDGVVYYGSLIGKALLAVLKDVEQP